ncbi:hypothetical protein PISL3812_08130 [Talaromyces islandicus]|uniref:Uncharacterized protein n=1 Tax=Talaromyces islandicus TaxID=28573 RepID=A0A0U1M6U5_TALIS|nr:hypothetical protein PISL3812_08130 [Talaromyces islandicus]
MLGLCEDLRGRAIADLDQIIEKLESSSNDAPLKPAKRMLETQDAEYNTSKRAMITSDNVEDMLSMPSGEAQRDIPEFFEDGSVFEGVDLFAPPLFRDFPQPPVNNFDPPFFETSSLEDHIGIPDNTTEPYLSADLASHETIDQWAQEEQP